MGSEGGGKKRDVVFVYSKAKKSGALKVIRAREDRVEVGEIREPKDGERIDGDLVRLKPREEHERLFDVETVTTQERLATAGTDGPAQVATDSYRQGWDDVFGKKRKPRKAQYLN